MSEDESSPAARPYDETVSSDPSILDARRISLHAERPLLVKRVVEDRVAVITRRTVVERRSVEIELLHEELSIEYRPGDGSEIFAPNGDTIHVALRAEDFEIVKRVRVVEDVAIEKRSVTRHERQAVTLRHEELATDLVPPSLRS